ERRLAGTGGPDHADNLAGLNLERDSLQDLETAEALVHAFRLDHWVGTRYLAHVLDPVTDGQSSEQSLKGRLWQLPRRTTTKIALEVVLAERQQCRDDQVPDAGHDE